MLDITKLTLTLALLTMAIGAAPAQELERGDTPEKPGNDGNKPGF
jgi:hypothetical protein